MSSDQIKNHLMEIIEGAVQPDIDDDRNPEALSLDAPLLANQSPTPQIDPTAFRDPDKARSSWDEAVDWWLSHNFFDEDVPSGGGLMVGPQEMAKLGNFLKDALLPLMAGDIGLAGVGGLGPFDPVPVPFGQIVGKGAKGAKAGVRAVRGAVRGGDEAAEAVSAVVRDAPEATTYYHGTAADFEDFDYGGDLLEPGTWGRNIPNADSGLGFHFSTSPESARFIGPNIMERRLRLKKPLEIPDLRYTQDLRSRAYISELGLDDLYEESYRAFRVKEGLPPISDAADPASRLVADIHEKTFLEHWRKEAKRAQDRWIMQRDHPDVRTRANEYSEYYGLNQIGSSDPIVPNLDFVMDEQYELYSELTGSGVAQGNPWGVGTRGDGITRDWLKSFGYDGLHIQEAFMGPDATLYKRGLPEQSSWVVFDPDQISKLEDDIWEDSALAGYEPSDPPGVEGPPGRPDQFGPEDDIPLVDTLNQISGAGRYRAMMARGRAEARTWFDNLSDEDQAAAILEWEKSSKPHYIDPDHVFDPADDYDVRNAYTAARRAGEG